MNPALALFFLFIQTLFLFCLLGLVMYGVYILWTMRNELPYVPTPYSVIRRMIAAADITSHDRVADLGSGTGRIVLEVARRYPVAVTGVDYSPLLLSAARLRQRFTRIKGKVTWVCGDLFTFPLDGTTVVFCFLITDVLARLAPRFERLPNGARIVSYKFQIPLSAAWEKKEIFFKNDVIYCYTKK